MRIALAIASSLLLAGTAAQAQPNCVDRCEVVITMSAGCGSGIKVAPDPIIVPAGKAPDITWTVQNDAWAFDAGGIVIHNGGDAFDKAEGGGRKLKIKNKNRKAATYKYDVILKGPGGQCKLDPVIINE